MELLPFYQLPHPHRMVFTSLLALFRRDGATVVCKRDRPWCVPEETAFAQSEEGESEIAHDRR